MTRRESLLAFSAAFLLFAGGLVWLLGAYGLLAAGVLLALSTLFFVRVEGDSGGKSVGDAVPQPADLFAAFERDLTL